jgi:outer membrane protein
VDLQAGYSVAHYPRGTITAPSFNSRTTNASVGVALNVPLLPASPSRTACVKLCALEEKARADLETTRRAIAQTTRAAYFGLESGRGQVDALEAAERSSKSALEANQLGYQVGVRINIDVLNAQSQLFQTQRDLAQARYNVLLGTLAAPGGGTLGMTTCAK